jgi:citrate lyase acyl carrier protein
MNIVREAYAGTLESSDLMVRVSPGKGGLDVSVTSIVMAQFGAAIKAEIEKTLASLGVADATVTADDKGALDCVIRARVQAAVSRAADAPIMPWQAGGTS